ncbi:hypothetical protein MUP00_13020 [Candidatus Bathyarchaeota archaeon]|nr:hypothetical protein [Candidatus Bathyarchaeota archaeon]
MPKGRPWGLVSVGVAVIMVAFFYLLNVTGLVSLAEVPMLTFAGMGVWLLVMSGMKILEPIGEEIQAPIIAGWGVILLMLGLVGTLSVRGYSLGVLMAGFGMVLGLLIVYAASRTWPRSSNLARTGLGERIKP